MRPHAAARIRELLSNSRAVMLLSYGQKKCNEDDDDDDTNDDVEYGCDDRSDDYRKRIDA